ncbi:hypothetical protein [Chryseobacterium sp.]|uniref:hypothetical protein n=1 Tax=Chryseobacterium sp. TaxID=1871047 RepID=UPI0025BC3B9B|nr:hypothetical protein [Chryseobacterium sp.]
MSKDQFQNKYDEIFREIKEEKMDWSFEDLLQKAESKEEDTPIIPLGKTKPKIPKWFWMAAGLLILLSIGFIFNYINHSVIDEKDTLVENEIQKQKSKFIEENNEHQEQIALHNNDSISGAKKDSVFQDNSIAEKDVLDEILSKRSRLKKETKPRFVDNSTYKSSPKYTSVKKDSTGYKDNYVIVNGKRIDNVEEAINVTKYSFQVFANASERMTSTQVMDNVD